jgi:hypothetical protein
MAAWTRRGVLRAGGLGAGALGLGLGGALLPGRARAAAPADRKLLFVFCHRGWDPAFVFTPPAGAVRADTGSAAASVAGVDFVDNRNRPKVRRFFERWGSESCIINGIEVPSIVHERCQRLLLTGFGDAGRDDWPSILAAAGGDSLGLPYLVMAGVSFTREHTDKVVRVGDDGQLPRLLQGAVTSEMRGLGGLRGPSEAAQAAEQAYIQGRLGRAAAGAGDQAAWAAAQLEALQRVDRLSALRGSVDLSVPGGGCERDLTDDAATVMTAMELGLSRCAMIQSDGWCSNGWDTHTGNDRQALHYDGLFGYLDEIMTDRAGRVSPTGRALADELTIVVLSEMGRSPSPNSAGGKDHWPYTSALLIGAGVRGGQTLGAVDGEGKGVALDLDSGATGAGGELIGAGHFGATLLTLGGVSPGDVGLSQPPIRAALSEEA